MGLTLDNQNNELGFSEKAAISAAPGAGRGVFWVKNDTPSKPYFTDDAGTDFDLAGGGGGGGTVQGTDGTYDIQATDDGSPDGDPRGENSIDLQTKRTTAAQIASGVGSAIVGGKNNTASGDYSFVAGGSGNVASGDNSHASGYKTTASGSGSLAFGNALGTGTIIASNMGAAAFGRTGTGGNVYSGGSGSMAFGFAIGASVSANSNGSLAGGYANYGNIYSTAHGAVALGYATASSNMTASGIGSFLSGKAEGGTITASGDGSRAGGFSYGGYITAGTDHGSWAFGLARTSAAINASGDGSHASGYAQTYSALVASGKGSHAEGYAFGDGKSSGYGIVASGKGSHAEGYGGTDGVNLTASGTGSHAEGWNTVASGVASHAQGRETQATAAYSCALGQESSASRIAQVALASGQFSAKGDAQTSQHVLMASTTNATQTEMFLNNTSPNRLVLPNDTIWAFHILVAARRTDANDEGASYFFEGAIDRNATAGTTALIGTPAKTVNEDTAAWDVDVNADTTNGALRIQVTGEAAKTVRWVAFVRTVEITG